MSVPTTRIEVDPGYAFSGYAERQKLYFDHSRGALIPGIEIWEAGELQLRVNRFGCKGDELEPSMPVIGFFGDSTTMGHAFTPDSWPTHVDVAGYAVLNAGVEGLDMERVAGRYEVLAQELSLAGAVVYVGWHNLVYNRTDETYWEEQLVRFLGSHVTAYCTLASCLIEEARARGFAALLNTAPVAGGVGAAAEAASLDTDYFNFWMDMDPDEYLGPILDGIERYNSFLRDFAERRGALLIDLRAALLPGSYEAMAQDFYDVCHIRPRAYAKVGRYVGDVLGCALPTVTAGMETELR